MDGNMSSAGPPMTMYNRSIPFPQGYIIGLAMFNVVFAIVGTFGNVLVLITIVKNQCLQTIPDLFIFSLAFADLTVSMFRQPILVYEASNHFKNHIYTDGSLMVFRKVINTGNYATVICLLAVTIDRYIAIQHPFKYQEYCTKKRAIVAILICWVGAGTTAVLVALDESGARRSLWVFTLLCLVSTVAIYVHLFCIANKQENQIVSVQPSEQERGHPTGRHLRERKAAKTIALVVGVYLLFYVPFLSYTISQKFKPYFMYGFYYFFSFMMCNSALNPYIYCMRNTRYRLAFAHILRLKRNVSLENTSGAGGQP